MKADNSLKGKLIYEFGDFRLDTGERVMKKAGQPLSVTPKALDVLIVLVESRGRIVEKEDLLRRVWPETFVEENNLTSTIYVLRKLFGESGAAPRYIETIPKRGYRFIAELVEAPDADVQRERRPYRWIFSGIALTLAAAGILAYYVPRRPKLTDRDTIILADFLNQTGDPVFDGTLRQGLTVQLEQSPFLSLISQERIQQILRLMDQPVEARLTPELAREVCERTASAAVLDGSIGMLGNQYVLGLRAKNCRSGEILDEEQAQAARKEDVLKALSQIGRKFRVRVGESLATVKKYDTPLAEATTQSLAALKAYSAAWRILSSQGSAAALPFFKRATELDPQFAMAHGFVGRMYGDLGESALSAESTKRAWQLREHTSDREKFWITASYEMQVLGNMEKARATSEFWSRAYPRDAVPHDMLAGIIYPVLGSYAKGVEEGRRAVELDPDFAISYNVLALSYQLVDQWAKAEETLQRATNRQLDFPDLLSERYVVAFLKGDLAGMERQAALGRGKSGAEDWLSSQEAFVLAYAGRLREARTKARQAAASAQQAGLPERVALATAAPAVWEAFSGNAPAARQTALAALKISKARDVVFGAALALAMAGNSALVQTLANDLQTRFPEDTSVEFSYLPVLRARLALSQGEPGKAIELLQPTVPYELGTPASSYFGSSGALYPIYLRGQAYLALHKGASASAEFRKILEHRGVVINDPVGALAHLQLGRALILSGDRIKAKAAYEDFLGVWREADAGIPILEQAKAEYAKLR